MKFLLPTGIGDSVWALHKIEAIRDAQDPGGTIDILLACGEASHLESRALDFVRRFSFVDSAAMFPGCGLGRYPLIRPDGCYNYLDDGWWEYEGVRYCVLIPNATLERGERLESWLPHYPIDWSIWNRFRISREESKFAHDIHKTIGRYAVFYPGPLEGNTINGHNRNMLWRPQDWVELGNRVHKELQLPVLLVGASYDLSYYEQLLRPIADPDTWMDLNLIGRTNLGQLWSLTSLAQFVVSYQAGVGIVSTYLSTPTAMFWRPHGDSISPAAYLTFDERMASAWVPPAILASGKHLPCIYGRDGVQQIMKWARRWAE